MAVASWQAVALPYAVFCMRRRIYLVFLCAVTAMLFYVAGWFARHGEMPSSVTRPIVAVDGEFQGGGQTVASADASDPLISPRLFSPAMEKLVNAADRGWQFTFRSPGIADQDILLRPHSVLAEHFRLNIGAEKNDRAGDVENGIRVYQGRSYLKNSHGPAARVSMVVVGSVMHLDILAADGSQLAISGSDPANVDVALTIGSPEVGAQCRLDGNVRALLSSPIKDPLVTAGLSQNLTQGTIEYEPAVLGLSGSDPATGKLDRFVEPIPLAEQYALSLKEILLLLVLDKSATGDGSRDNLEAKASQTIARIANVATIYENQLGLRLLLQELILIPNTDAYADIPSRDALKDFRDWCHTNRRFSSYDWTCAMKEGAGLRGEASLGIANVGRVFHREAVSVVRANSNYLVYAHELAHNLGTLHTNGGIMSSSVMPNHLRSFFNDVIGADGKTAAKDIYSYLSPRLAGAVAMRHPEEMPFAMSDVAETGEGDPVAIRVLANDADHVRHGKVNSVVSVIETSRVLPEGAGTVSIRSNGQGVQFFPTPGFSGTAWFSYTIRGNVGNESQGWLHKGDVAVNVGRGENAEDDAREIQLRPGASYSFYPSGSESAFTQPKHARIDRSADDNDLLILRVSADAEGGDTFEVGENTYAISYRDDPPLAVTDTAWIDRYRSSIWIQPLENDAGAGLHWLHQVDPLIGIVAGLNAPAASHFFPTTMRLVGAENLDSELGAITLEQLPVTINGRSQLVHTGRILFQSNSDTEGTGSIIYTMEDASGRRAEGVIQVHVNSGYDRLVDIDSMAAVVVPDASIADQLAKWENEDFDDSDWLRGPLGVGYESRTGYEQWIGTNVSDALFRNGTSVYVRVSFAVPETADYSALGFRARFDDGFVAYLNGREVVSKNAPLSEGLTWKSAATVSDEHDQDEPFYVVDISAHRDILKSGSNVLALHVMNDEASSSDLLMQPALVAFPAAPEAPAVSPFFASFMEWRGTFAGSDVALDPDWTKWDSDFDSYPDRIEFAAGRSPVNSARQPVLSVDSVKSGVRQTVNLRYLRRIDADELGITYIIEQASALEDDNQSGWERIDLDALTDGGGSVTVSPFSAGVETVVVRIPFDSRDVSAKYYRMRYVLPE
ncbi:MAG: hypothetical protein ACI9R3_001249 [Verrucomicrobiales bacterium]